MLEIPINIGPVSALVGSEQVWYEHLSFADSLLQAAYDEVGAPAASEAAKVAEPISRYSLPQKTEPPQHPPPWFVGFAKSFKDDLRSTDRKLQGRILEALSKLVEAPMVLVGDTEKPLSGDLAGFWRYRIGDYRLVYYPDPKSGNITLYHFSARGDVYA